MGAWGFVALAYGMVSAIVIIYCVSLKRRHRKAETELEQLRAAQSGNHDVEK